MDTNKSAAVAKRNRFLERKFGLTPEEAMQLSALPSQFKILKELEDWREENGQLGASNSPLTRGMLLELMGRAKKSASQDAQLLGSLVRLANDNPELRKDLLPLIKSGSFNVEREFGRDAQVEVARIGRSLVHGVQGAMQQAAQRVLLQNATKIARRGGGTIDPRALVSAVTIVTQSPTDGLNEALYAYLKDKYGDEPWYPGEDGA